MRISMKIITSKEIQNYSYKKIDFLYAQNLLENNCIEKMTVKTLENIKYQIDGIVHILGKDINCSIEIDNQCNLIQTQCDCQKNHDHCCGYVLAILMFLSKTEINEFPFVWVHPERELRMNRVHEKQEERWNKQKSKLILKSRQLLLKEKTKYEQNLIQASINQDMEIVPILTYDYGELLLSFKVGQKNKYIIKSIPEFIERIEQRATFSYGKNLTFSHQYDCFNEESKKQIDFMKAHLGVFNRTNVYDRINEKQFEIKGALLDDYFEVFKEIEEKINLESIEASIKIKVNEKEDLYQFKFADNLFILGATHLYVYYDLANTLLQYRCDEQGKTVNFIHELMQQDIYVLKQEYPQFYKYVLSEIMPYLDIQGLSMLEETIEPCVLIKLFGDIDDSNQVVFSLEYYDENGKVTKGFDEQNIIGYNQELVETTIQKYASYIDKTNHIAYFNSEDEDTFEFISNGLPYLSKYCEIFVSEALHNLGKNHEYTIQVGVKFESDLLSIDINSLEIPKGELGEVLNAYRRKKKFYRLKNGKLLVLNSKQLEELDDLLESYHLSGKDLNRGTVEVPSYRLFSLDKKMNDVQYIQTKRSKTFENQVNRFKEIKSNQYPLSAKYQQILRDYQKEGYQWLSLMRDYGFNGILADDMGLGKTLQVIALLDENKANKPSLVICPASLIYNWDDEIRKFTDSLHAVCICGNANERQLKIMEAHKYDLLITSYDYIRRDIEWYENLEFDTVILDEAQNIKNQKTKNAISVKKLHAKHKIALTGTPIENSLAELWSIFDFLMPNYLFNYHYFQAQYETAIVKNHDNKKQEVLKQLVSPFILRRNKKDVLKELPEKIEKVQYIDFDEEEYKIYLANLAKVNDELAEMAHMENQDKIAILAMLTRLRQLCCEPRLMYENITKCSSKMNACMELVHSFHENNQKILLFSSFTSMLDLIEKELHREGISYLKLTGKTSKEDRKMLVDQFQNDNTTVFLISLKAGGTGLNLTAAEAVIHYDPWWNQSAQNQATDRAYRIGQNKNVQVFKLVMKNSIEEKIQKLQLMKKELADTFVESNEGSIAKMSKEEIMQLFAIDA